MSRKLKRRGFLGAIGVVGIGEAFSAPTTARRPAGDSARHPIASESADGWPQRWYGPGQTGFGAIEHAPETDFSDRWSRRFAIESSGTKSASFHPVVDGTTLFVAQDRSGSAGPDGRLSAIDVATGRVRWRTAVGEPTTTPAVRDGVVFLGHGDRTQAFDATRGAVRWTSDRSLTDLRVTSESVFGRNGRGIAVLDRTDGSLTGRYRGTVRRLGGVVDSVAYALVGERSIVAFDAERGDRRWKRRGDAAFSELVVAGNTCYALGGDAIHAIDTVSGERRWRVGPSDGTTVTGHPVVGSELYAPTDEGVIALDTATGTERWRCDPVHTSRGRSAAFAPGGPTISAAGDVIYALGWREGKSAVGDETGTLTTIDTTDGALIDEYEIGSRSDRYDDHAFAPISAGGTVYVGRRATEGSVTVLALDGRRATAASEANDALR